MRLLPYWQDAIVPRLRVGEQVLLVAYNNSVRALVKHLSAIPDDQIVALYIPHCIPLVYEFDDQLTPIRDFYLGDQDAVVHTRQVVADQLK